MLFGGYELEPVSPLDRRRALGARRPRPCRPTIERFEPLMAGAIRRFPFLADAEVGPARLPPRRDDAGREPAARARCPASAASGSPPACRSTASAAAAGSAGRWPAGSRPAIRASTSSPYRRLAVRPIRTATRSMRAGSPARPTRYYYRLRYPFDADVAGRPRRLSALHGRLQETGRGLRRQGRLGAGRLPRARARLAAGRTRPARLGLDEAALPRSGRRRGRGGPRAGRPDRPELVRQDRGRGPGRARAPPAGRRQRPRPRRSAAVVYSQFLDARRRDGGRRDGDPAGRRPVPGRDRAPGYVAGDLGWLRDPRADGRRPRHAPRRERRAGACIGLWGPRARDVLAARHRRVGATTRRCRCAGRRGDPDRRGAGPRRPDQLRRASSAGSCTRSVSGRSRSGTALVDGRRRARARAVRLSRARRAPAGEGLSLLRHRPDRPRDTRSKPASARSSGRERVRSSAATRSSSGGRHGLAIGCGRSSSAAADVPAGLRRGGRPARWRDRRPAPQRRLRPDGEAARSARSTCRPTSPKERRLEVDVFAGRASGDRRSRRPGRPGRRPDARLTDRQTSPLTSASQASRSGEPSLASARPHRSTAQPQKS